VKKDPEFAKARLPEYTDQDQENAIEHIRCGWLAQLNSNR
jgi:hypothetical protein